MEPTQNTPSPAPNNNPPIEPAPLPAEQPAPNQQPFTNPPVSGQPLQPSAIYPAPAQAPAAPAAAEDDHKDYVVAFLLSWLLGGMGADRFYLGYTKSAIVKLITLGGLGVWAVIDVWRLAFGKLNDRSGLPLRGYEKNKSWTRALAIIHLIVLVMFVLFFVFAIVLSTKNGVQQKAYDVERKTDIKALQGALEVYKSRVGEYPTLAQMNSASFRQANFSNLPADTYKDPQGSTDQLSASPQSDQYSYAPTPTDCTDQGNDKCVAYSLNALLDAGGYYTKYSNQ